MKKASILSLSLSLCQVHQHLVRKLTSERMFHLSFSFLSQVLLEGKSLMELFRQVRIVEFRYMAPKKFLCLNCSNIYHIHLHKCVYYILSQQHVWNFFFYFVR